MKSKLLAALTLVAAPMLVPALAAADPAMLGNTCAGCHGTDGASVGQAPIIGGLDKGYLIETMQNYKNGTRYATVMDRIAKGYDDAQIEAMSEFLAAKPWVSSGAKGDSTRIKRAVKTHQTAGCINCHGAAGVSPVPGIPRLSGQFPAYLYLTMKDYADPDKPITKKAEAMRAMLQGLSDQDLHDLATLYASQK